MNMQVADRAVVLGAGMAGLLAARVLADAYAEVVIVDRDELPDGAGPRRGIPQGRHAHGLLARGQQALEELLPGLTADLLARGVPAGDLLGGLRWYLNGHRLRRVDTGLVVLSTSRPFLEGQVRARLRALPNVVFVDNCDVVGLATDPDGHRVIGARVIRRADGSAEEVVSAGLVIDALGRGSRTPVWLETLGYRPPPVQRAPIGLGYATRTYRLRPGALGGDLAVLAGATPAYPRSGVLAMLEGDRHMLTLSGILGDHPPTDPDGFLAFARSLHHPDIYQAIRDAEPLDDPVAYRFPTSLRRRYERLAHFPGGFLVIGDGVCSFNPVYAQGMTVAAMQALTLRRHLRHGAQPQPRRFFRDIAKVINAPWDIAVGGDLAFPGVDGRRTPKIRLLNAYIAALHAGAAHDASLATAFVRVAGLVDRPETLLHPRVLLRLLRHHLREPTRRRPAAPPPRASVVAAAQSERGD